MSGGRRGGAADLREGDLRVALFLGVMAIAAPVLSLTRSTLRSPSDDSPPSESGTGTNGDVVGSDTMQAEGEGQLRAFAVMEGGDPPATETERSASWGRAVEVLDEMRRMAALFSSEPEMPDEARRILQEAAEDFDRERRLAVARVGLRAARVAVG